MNDCFSKAGPVNKWHWYLLGKSQILTLTKLDMLELYLKKKKNLSRKKFLVMTFSKENVNYGIRS